MGVFKSLGQTKWLDTAVLASFVKLMPSSQNSCIVLPTNWLTGWSLESYEYSAKVMLGLGKMKRKHGVVDLIGDHVIEHETDNAEEECTTIFSKDFHAYMGARYDPLSKRLLVSHGDCIACVCFDGTSHFRVMVAEICAPTVFLCVWDPLDVDAKRIIDEQVQDARAVLQAILPEYVVKVVGAKSLRLLGSSEVFNTRQLDGFQCGAFSICALVQLVYNADFVLGKQSLRNIRIWMAACLAQGQISI